MSYHFRQLLCWFHFYYEITLVILRVQKIAFIDIAFGTRECDCLFILRRPYAYTWLSCSVLIPFSMVYICVCVCVWVHIFILARVPPSRSKNQIHGLVKPKLRLSTDRQRIPPPYRHRHHRTPKSWIEQMVPYHISPVSIWWLLQLLSSAELNVKKLRMVPQYYPSIIWAPTSLFQRHKYTAHHALHSSFIEDHAADNKIHTWMVAAATAAQRYDIV